MHRQRDSRLRDQVRATLGLPGCDEFGCRCAGYPRAPSPNASAKQNVAIGANTADFHLILFLRLIDPRQNPAPN